MNSVSNHDSRITGPATTNIGTTGGDATIATPTPETSPILGGNPLTVTAPNDFEKLLAEMQAENDERVGALTVRLMAAMLTSLASQHKVESAEQQKSLEDLASASTDYATACDAYLDAQREQLAAQAEIAVLTAKLEKMVECETTTPEEREERQRLEDDLEKARQKEIKADEDMAAANDRKQVAAARSQTVLCKLDSASMRLVANCLAEVVQIIAAASAERNEGNEIEEEASAIIKALGEYADKIEEMSEEKLEEMVAKVGDALKFIAETKVELTPDQLPETKTYV